MDVPVRTISMFLVLFLGAYNLWPAIQGAEKLLVFFGIVSLVIFTTLLNTMLTAFRRAKNAKAQIAKDNFELFTRPIPYRFHHEGRNYDTSEAKFLSGLIAGTSCRRPAAIKKQIERPKALARAGRVQMFR